MNNPKTTIWRSGIDGFVLIAEQSGIPSPVPKMGQPVSVPDYGNTICTGITTSGTDNTVIEVKLTLK